MSSAARHEVDDGTHPNCRRFGLFDERNRQERLALVGIGGQDRALGERLQIEVVRPNIEWIVSEFYGFLKQTPGATGFLDKPGRLERLSATLHKYLESLGVGFDTPSYFEDRLQVGLVHYEIGLPLTLYMAAYSKLNLLILESAGSFWNELHAFILKITALDISLAIETYNAAEVANVQDTLDLVRQEGRTDVVTGAPNRMQVMSDLDAFINAESSFCCAMVDIDHFKHVNDEHGHLIGDRVLETVVGRIRRTLREDDLIGRYGGDEFLVIFKDADLRASRRIAERLRIRVSRDPVKIDDLTVRLTVSVGLARARPMEDRDALILRADTAMYQAKREGRNRVVAADDQLATQPM